MSDVTATESRDEDAPLAVICLAGDPSLMARPDADAREVQRAAQRAAKAICGLVGEGFRALIIPPGTSAIDRELIRNEEASTKLAPSSMSEAAAAAQQWTGGGGPHSGGEGA